jgi:hypothetical protein
MTLLTDHPEVIIILVTNIISLAFGAGFMYFTIKQTRGHVNGIGKKVANMQLAMLTFCPESQREKMADLLK